MEKEQSLRNAAFMKDKLEKLTGEKNMAALLAHRKPVERKHSHIYSGFVQRNYRLLCGI